jgi:hypothetical protein
MTSARSLNRTCTWGAKRGKEPKINERDEQSDRSVGGAYMRGSISAGENKHNLRTDSTARYCSVQTGELMPLRMACRETKAAEG